MEYILEELLRQRNALAELMTGKTPEEQESGETGIKNGSEVFPSGKSEWPDTAVDGHRGTVFQRDEKAPLDEELWNILREDGIAILSQENNGPGAMVLKERKTVSETAQEWTRGASEVRELPWSAKFPADAGITETADERAIVHWDVRTAEMDARALSRAVQRDARRYDGGFNAR